MKYSVAVLMGSDSDWPIMREACEMLDFFEVKYLKRVISAHRTPTDLIQFVKEAEESGVKVFIAGAGGAAHLPGVVAAFSTFPVIGVPIRTQSLGGADSLYSIVQMPKGIPVATVAIQGAANAGILASQILSVESEALAKRVRNHREKISQESREKNVNIK